MVKYKILIFDLDDTLIDNKENVRFGFKRMLERAGSDYSEDGFARWYKIDQQFWRDWQDDKVEIPDRFKGEVGKKSEEFLDWLRSQRVLTYFDNSISPERAIKLNRLYMNALTEHVVPIDGVRETLKYLSEKYMIVVATNGPRVATRQKLEEIGVFWYIAEALSADMFGFMKPKMEFFKAIEERYKDFDRGDYLIIGDSLKSDVGFGQVAGIDSCWFSKDGEAATGDYSPTYVVNKLAELKEFL